MIAAVFKQTIISTATLSVSMIILIVDLSMIPTTQSSSNHLFFSCSRGAKAFLLFAFPSTPYIFHSPQPQVSSVKLSFYVGGKECLVKRS